MKTILVSGGAGFIGSNLCERLVADGNIVVCLDNLLTGSQKNIAHLMSHKNFFFFKHDVTKPFLSKKFKRIDEVYHLASPADPNTKSEVSYMSFPFETMRVNSVGTWELCELALKNNARLSFASTSEVYGDPQKTPQDEDYRGNVSTTGPRSVYDEAKRFGETIVSSFVRLKNLDGVITRIFNTYGPKMNPDEGRAVVDFMRQSLRGEDITVYGDGKQTRSFCYIDDQIEGQILAMKKGICGEVYNIGNPVENTVLNFAKKIKAISKSSSEIIFEPLPIDDPKKRKPDIEKAEQHLGWKPKVGLDEGLQKTLVYFRSIL